MPPEGFARGRTTFWLVNVVSSFLCCLNMAARTPETADHRIRRRTIKNTQTVTMTAMAAKGYIRKLDESKLAGMVVISCSLRL
jgi:hypothetical protein